MPLMVAYDTWSNSAREVGFMFPCLLAGDTRRTRLDPDTSLCMFKGMLLMRCGDREVLGLVEGGTHTSLTFD